MSIEEESTPPSSTARRKRGRPPKTPTPSPQDARPSKTPSANPDIREAPRFAREVVAIRTPPAPAPNPTHLAYDDYRSSNNNVTQGRSRKRKEEAVFHAESTQRISPNREKRPKIEPAPGVIYLSSDNEDDQAYGQISDQALNGYLRSNNENDQTYGQISEEELNNYLRSNNEDDKTFRQISDQAPNGLTIAQQPLPPTAASWQPPPQLPRIETDVPMDHNGNVLTGEALDFAELYWECQREYDHCPFHVGSVQGPHPEEDPLVRMAACRRRYTEAVLGRRLEPGMRTFEPPYIRPPGLISVSADGMIMAQIGAPPPEAPPAPRNPRPTLSREQQNVVDQVVAGHNVFYTGSAGCGKSTVLHAMRRRLREKGLRVRVMAPTGIVALAINGDTTWRFAGWNPATLKKPLNEILMGCGKNTRRRLKQADVIIIDEISMVENHHFERLNILLKTVRQDNRPFGGVQVIVTGDFCQLPPVKPFEYCMMCGRGMIRDTTGDEPTYRCPQCNKVHTESEKWAFRSSAWEECNFVHIHLDGIHRQSDPLFISMLQKCRIGAPLLPDETDILMNHQSNTANAITLYSTREEVSRENQRRFEALKTEMHSYRCYDVFDWNGRDEMQKRIDSVLAADGYSLQSLKDHRFSPSLVLKVGMPVVLLANLDIPGGLCNGSQGIIAGFEPYDPEKLPKKTNGESGLSGDLTGEYAHIREMHIKKFCESQKQGLMFPVVRWLRDMSQQRVIIPDCVVTERGEPSRGGGGRGGDDDNSGGWTYSLLCRTQVPLAPAWAISIHKSQGMTLDRVIVDLSRAFEEGQVYVALSRATGLKGLTVKGDPNGLAVGAGGNQEVRAFLKAKFGI